MVSDGITLRGRVFFPTGHPSRQYPALIICHGIPGSGADRPKDDPGYEALAMEFSGLGAAAVIFNFRGCGESDGDFDMLGWAHDLEVILDRVRNTPYIDPTRILVVGFSGGGAAAIRAAADNPEVYGLAVVGTPADFKIFEKDPAEIIEDFRKRGLFRNPDFPPDISRWIGNFEEMEPRRWVAYFKGKHLLIVHGDADELIPVDQARELFRLAPAGVKELRILQGGVHRLRLDPRCRDLLNEWFLKTIGWA